MSRSFIDRISALTELCVKKENRVVDLGNKKEDKTKKGKKKEGEEQEENFEFLNLSELQDQRPSSRLKTKTAILKSLRELTSSSSSS